MAMDSRQVLSSGSRKKIDSVEPIENILWNENLENQENESKCDMRKSLAWDSAFFTSPGVLDVEELFASLDIREKDVDGDAKSKYSNGAFRFTSSQSEKTNGTDESSGRRSLAWNSAFFTDPGVLNTEELHLVNGGFNKTGSHKIHETNKKLWKSLDSSSTTQKSRFSVTSIESDLFEDLRTKGYSSRLPIAKSEEIRDLKSLKEPDSSFARKKSKPLPPSGRQKMNLQRHKMVQKERPRLSPLAKSGESTPSPCQLQGKFMSMNKTPSPTEYAKPKKPSAGFENERSQGMVKNSCSVEQYGSTPTVRSAYTRAKRREVEPTNSLISVDRTLDLPSRVTPLADIASKGVRASSMRLPLPKIGYFDSENTRKENKPPNSAPNGEAAATRRRLRKSPQMGSTDGRPSPLGRRKTVKSEGTEVIEKKTKRHTGAVMNF